MEVELAFFPRFVFGKAGRIQTPQLIAKAKEQRVVLASVVDV